MLRVAQRVDDGATHHGPRHATQQRSEHQRLGRPSHCHGRDARLREDVAEHFVLGGLGPWQGSCPLGGEERVDGIGHEPPPQRVAAVRNSSRPRR